MLESGEGVSDCLFINGKPPFVERYGKLHELPMEEPGATLQSAHIDAMADLLLADSERLHADLADDRFLRHQLRLPGDLARFRVNIYRQNGHTGIVMRKLQSQVPTIESLGLPPIFSRDREGKKRHHFRHRQHRQRQDHHPGCDAKRAQPDPGSARRHARGPDRICSPAWQGGLQPARNGQGLPRFCDRLARGPAPGAEGDPDRRSARPRNDGDRSHRLRNRVTSFSARCTRSTPARASTASLVSSRPTKKNRCANGSPTPCVTS